MIERLLAASRALEADDLDRADRLFAQVAEADSRNAIAVVGLAEVARRRGRVADAAGLVERALAIDPEDDAARRLQQALAEMPTETSAGADADAPTTAGVPSRAREAPRRRSFLDRLRALLRRTP